MIELDENMNILGKYEENIAKRPVVAIVAIVVITAFMGYFASNVSMDTTEESFQPDSKVARAQNRVNENYGAQGEEVTIIFDAGSNVLKRDILLKQLELEKEILNSNYSDFLRDTSRNPSGISSPAKTIAQAKFLNKALTDIMNKKLSFGTENIIRQLTSIMFNLSTEDMRQVLKGGSLQLKIPEIGLEKNLNFQPYNPDMIPIYLKNAPFENVLSFQLSQDYNTDNQTASKSLVNIAIEENLTQKKSLEIQRGFQTIVKGIEETGEGFKALTVGSAIVNDEINKASGRNIGILMPIAFIVVIIILFIVYRTVTDTFLNLIALVMAVVWVYGIGYLLDFTFSPNITAVPLLMIGLGIDYGIHYTLRYREEIKKKQNITRAVRLTGTTVGLAILLTTITTVVGFSSGVISDISAVRQFGVLSSVGIASSFVVMLTFFPAAKVLIDRRRKNSGGDLADGREYRSNLFGSSKDEDTDWDEYGEDDCADCDTTSLKAGAIAAKKPLAVIGVVVIITGIGIYGANELDARYDYRDFLPEGLEVTESFGILVNDFDFGQERVYFLVEGDVTSPSIFTSIGDVERRALDSLFAVESDPQESPLQLGKSLSTLSSPEFNPEFAKIWRSEVDSNSDGQIDSGIEETNVEAIYDALYKYAPEEAERVLNRTSEGYSGLVIRIPVSSERGDSGDLVDDMDYASEPFRGKEMESVIVTGQPIVSHQTFQSINEGQVTTVLITFLISLTILTGLYFYMRRSKLLGFVVISPLVLVIIWILGSMYYIGIPLNPVTVTIAAIMVGLGVDYSIHLTQRFLEDSKRIEKPECAICASVEHTGSALFGSAITTISGFAILSFAIIPPLAQFGQVSALGILFAFLASVLVLPTFLLAWLKNKG